MPWQEPTLVEIEMNAEIGAYQQDGDERETDEPVIDDDR